MKTKTIYLAILILISVISKAQWTVQASSFSTPGLGVNSISIINANTAWATAYDTAFAATVNKYTRTINGGSTWASGNITGAAGLDITSISGYNKDTAWVSMVDNNNGGGAIYKTLNGGTTWAKQTTATFASPGGWADFVYFFDKNNGVCVGDSNTGYWEIYTTLNGGTNWTRIPSGSVPANLAGETANDNAFSIVGNTVWFATTTGRVYKSINKGSTWTVAPTGLSNCKRVSFKDANNGIATDGTLLVKTTNGGATWTALSFTGNLYDTDLTYVPGTAGTYFSTGSTAAGGGTNGSSYSTNDGATWINIDAIGHEAVAFLNSTTGWSGGVNTSASAGGMFKWNGSFTTGIKNKDYVSGTQVIVYPNPFSDHITIEIRSEKNSTDKRTIEIIDVLGNSVFKESNFEGTQLTIQRQDLKNGVYFYKVSDSLSIISIGRLVAN
ncbi:MAG: T9SS type A sorting domain-containing protein [Bacteroidetes bacterium]|nr:T9SS type A sorting domain-containing protein [Bacteroidota bacterium]